MMDDYTVAIACYRLIEDLPTLGQLDRDRLKVVLDDVDESRVDAALDAMIAYGAVEELGGVLWPAEQEPDGP